MNIQKCAEIGRKVVINETKDSVRRIKQCFPYNLLSFIEHCGIEEVYTRKFSLAMRGYFNQRKKLQECGLTNELIEFDNEVSNITIKLHSMQIE